MSFRVVYISAVLIGFSGLLVTAYFKGMRDAQDTCALARQAELIAVERRHALDLQTKQLELLEVEQGWLNTDSHIQTVYRDRVKTVVKEVQSHVEKNHLADCRLDAHSLQQLNAALSGTASTYGVRLVAHDLP